MSRTTCVRRLWLILPLLLLGLLPGRPASAQDPLRIFVLPFTPQNRALKEQARVLYEAMQSGLLGTGRFLITASSSSDPQVEAAIKECNRESVDQTCWIRIGFSKGAQKMVSGQLRGRGKACYVTLRLVDLETRLEERRVFDAYSCKVEDLLSRVESYAWTLAGMQGTPTPPGPAPGPGGGPGPAPPQATGVLRVVTTPAGAAVYVDAEKKGVAPVTLEGLPAGEHSLLITKEGYVDLAKAVTVQAGRPTLVREKLARQSGTIEITSVPGGAVVMLDGKRQRGVTPLTINGAKVGRHEVRVSLKGHETWVNEIEVHASSTVRVMADLAGRSGTLLVSSTPKGADVFVDGDNQGKTIVSLTLTPGKHTLRVEKDGYRPEIREVTLGPAEKRSLSVTLSRAPTETAGDLSSFEVTVFTSESRAFNAQDQRMFAEFQRMGLKVDRRSYPSNPDSNIKVARGKRALAEQILAVVKRYYPERTFSIKEIFDAGDTDVFVNLGREEGAAAPEAPVAGGDSSLGRYEITVFTPDKRAFNPSDLAMLDEFERMGFRVDRRNYPSNPDSNIKVGSGDGALARRVQAVVLKHYAGDFALKEIFESGDTDIFINIGPATPRSGGSAPPSASDDSAAPGDAKVLIFTPGGRAFVDADRRLLRDLASAGFQVTDRPGGGGSNADSNVKVARGRRALGEQVQAIMKRCYDQPFQIKETFDAGDTDIFVNLGEDAEPKPGCGGGGSEAPPARGDGDGDFAGYRIRFFSPGGRALNSAEKGLQSRFRSMGFKVEDEPLGSDQPANIKVGSDQVGAGEAVKRILEATLGKSFDVKPSFDRGDTDVFINLGPDVSQPGRGDAPSAADLRGRMGDFKVVLFTPGGRAFNAQDRQIMFNLRALGLKVQEDPGGGGSNADSNVKVGRGFRAIGDIVQEVVRRCYDQPFEIKETFDPGDTDVFVNLGQDADSKQKRCSTSL